MSRNFVADTSSTQRPKTPQSPDSLQDVAAYARFEFEAGKGNEGTKLLMLEYEGQSESLNDGTWSVSWPGKSTVLPADERTSERSRRFYFLLPPGTPVPPKVFLTHHPAASRGPPVSPKAQTMTINPLPAIFAPELGASARATGKKGVLHTIWAKKRLQVLEREIKREETFNLEGIALEMAMAEKAWIEGNFGVVSARPTTIDIPSTPKYPNGPISPTLNTPRSPTGRRLSDKLRGLTLGTAEKDLIKKDAVNTPIHEYHPLSPEADDVAYSSFGSFRRDPTASGKKRMTPQSPPSSIKALQSKSPSSSMVSPAQPEDVEAEDDLFAKPLSPRSAGDPKSPFSMTSADSLPFSRTAKDT